MLFIVTKLVAKHRFYFFFCKLLYKRIVQNNSLCFSKAGKICIAVLAALRSIHHEHTVRLESDFRQQRKKPRFERTFFERSKFIEQRSNKTRIQNRNAKTEHDIHCAKQQPPP